jgi:hypothetical protein
MSTSSLHACSPCRRPRPRTHERGRLSASTLALHRSAAAPAFFFNTKHGHDYVRQQLPLLHLRCQQCQDRLPAHGRLRRSPTSPLCFNDKLCACMLYSTSPPPRYSISVRTFSTSSVVPDLTNVLPGEPLQLLEKSIVFISLSGVLLVLTAVSHPQVLPRQ